MSPHRCPAFARNSSLLVFVILFTGCKPQATSSVSVEQEPTWSFQNITWRTTDAEKKLFLRAELLNHFGDEIQAKNLTFSYEADGQSVAGSAALSKGSPQLQSIEFKGFTLNAEDLGNLEADRGELNTQTSELKLHKVEAKLREPPLELVTGFATLTMSADKTITVETSFIEGTLSDSVEH